MKVELSIDLRFQCKLVTTPLHTEGINMLDGMEDVEIILTFEAIPKNRLQEKTWALLYYIEGDLQAKIVCLQEKFG